MKLTAIISVAFGLAVLYPAAAGAADGSPAEVQDPPGHVGVEQPAGVTFEQRDTTADVTDTMFGARTEVIETPSEPADDRLVPRWANETATTSRLEPGREVRAALDESPTSRTGEEPAAGVPADDTYLGTDLGYGTGTEPVLVR